MTTHPGAIPRGLLCNCWTLLAANAADAAKVKEIGLTQTVLDMMETKLPCTPTSKQAKTERAFFFDGLPNIPGHGRTWVR